MGKTEFTEDQKVEIELMIADAVNKAIVGVHTEPKFKLKPDYKLPDNIGLLDVVTVKPTKENPHHTSRFGTIDKDGFYTCKGHQAQLHIQKGLAEADSITLVEKYEPKRGGRVLGKVEKA